MAGIIAQKYLAEFVGTMFFLLVILSTGGEALARRRCFSNCNYGCRKSSGGHLNPAVTVMMAVAKKMNSNDVLPYIVAQVAGGLVALELHKRLRK